MVGTDRRPRIALPLRPEDALRRRNYYAAVEAAGGELVNIWDDVDAAGFDGLLLPGGGDVEPSRYRRENRGSENIDPELDARQLAALDAFVKAGRPALGVCRGHQVINVFFGGTLIQDLPDADAHRGADDGDGAHATRSAADSFLARIYGERFPVNSAHHQAVDALGDGLEAVQWAPDGVIEGMRHRTLPVWGVQWHPERMCLARARADTVDGLKLIAWFAAVCKERSYGYTEI